MSIYIVWTGLLGLAMVAVVALADAAGVSDAGRTAIAAIGLFAALLPTTLSLGLVLALIYLVLMRPNVPADVDPFRQNHIFRVADLLGFVIAAGIAATIPILR